MATKKEKAERRASLRPHPARDQILDVMRSYGQPISPTQLARITGTTLGSTAYHVRTLVSAGLVELADEGRVRGAVEHFYALVPGSQGDIRLTDPVTQLLGLCGALTLPDPDGGYPRPAVIDDVARERLTAIIAQLSPEVQQIVAEALARADARRQG
ncbi:MAG TPA: helix-turn-helix domain-containing protein [Baekduia sp.]|uniref:helix-turn-helix domain-containing protein n=1 Tax=Baekduia sp. TaxID=2600305 RepID=UPI002D786D1F|nr:helix-turn-helix domain-containing protein [Baekduia sp.]HET6510168.1 helix-turn-helix domain-containing protein [Baekduia sp.]